MKNIERPLNCFNCFHFKTKLITQKNVEDLIWWDSPRLNKKIAQQGYARIWWCDKQNLKFLMTEYVAKTLCKRNCKDRVI